MARVAATFLELDQLIPTDRVWEFVGHLGLRAAAANFSPRDTDHVFRQFELPASLFSRQWRRVLAGIERLTYVDPFDLKEISVNCRRRQFKQLAASLYRHVQIMLDRYGVGDEMLGAEQLALLIATRVLDGVAGDPAMTPFDYFETLPGERPLKLLAMTTNLTLGKLEILGDPRAPRTRMIDGLLASSAFPAAFRPPAIR